MKSKPNTKLFEWRKKCTDGNHECRKCGEKRFLTIEHIVPVNILEQFMMDRLELLYNYEENFEILCRYCNYEKGARIDPRNPKTYQILAAVLQKSKEEALSALQE